MKLSEMDGMPEPHRIMIFGQPKMGKTEMAGELSQKFKTYWFDLEGGLKTLKISKRVNRDNLEIYRIPDTTSFPIGVETMLKVAVGKPLDICHLHGKVACVACKKDGLGFSHFPGLANLSCTDLVVVDSTNQLQLSALMHIMSGRDILVKPEWDDFRNQGVLVNKILSSFQQAPCHFVTMSHEIESEMEDGTKKLVPLIGTGPFSRNAGKYFDHVVYATVKGGKYTLLSNPLVNSRLAVGVRGDIDLGKLAEPSLIPLFGDTDYQAMAAAQVASPAVQATLEDSAKMAAAGVGGIGKPLVNPATLAFKLGGGK